MANTKTPLQRILRNFHKPQEAADRNLTASPDYTRGLQFAESWSGQPMAACENSPLPADESNPLWQFFCNRKEGHGIWKWTHYFDVYHRHFARFRGQAFNLLEIGIYSGGSLDMWKSYFGSGVQIHGVDIEDACSCYEDDNVTVHIGDQEDRSFWSDFRSKVNNIQILIDDGGHTPDQQMVTLEEMLPSMPPGSVYLCEDIHGVSNRFISFAAGLITQLNAQNSQKAEIPVAAAVPLQQSICSIHFYPYIVVIEKNHVAPSHLKAPKHGTEWQPFLG